MQLWRGGSARIIQMTRWPGSSIVGPSLAYIFKSCIDAEIFPHEWKIAKVTPLFKKGSKRELGN